MTPDNHFLISGDRVWCFDLWARDSRVSIKTRSISRPGKATVLVALVPDREVAREHWRKQVQAGARVLPASEGRALWDELA